MYYPEYNLLGKAHVWKDGLCYWVSFDLSGGFTQNMIEGSNRTEINKKINMWRDMGYDIIVGKPYRSIKSKR